MYHIILTQVLAEPWKGEENFTLFNSVPLKKTPKASCKIVTTTFRLGVAYGFCPHTVFG
jgi:hypothetical protein